MQIELQTRHLTLDPARRELIEQLAGRIANRFPDTMRLHVTLEHVPHHRHGSERVTLLGHAEARTLRSEKQGEDMREAIRAAFAAFESSLARHHARHRRPVKGAGARLRGSIKRIFRGAGYGFIHDGPGHDVYFHRDSLQGLRFDRLSPGDPVEFELEQGERGPQAARVAPPGAGARN